MWMLTPLLVALVSTSPCLSVQYVPIYQGPDSWWSVQFPNQTDTSICPHLDDPGNGSVSVEGHIATYSCQENFTLIGLDGNQRACVEGEWIGEDPECKRDGGWSNWAPWTDCTKTCESGSRTRVRSCTNPSPEPGGRNCTGNETELEICKTSKCPECKAIQKNLTVGLITISLGDTGDFIQFSCPATYRLVGNNTQPCNKDTELGAVTASCIRACPVLVNPLNGSVTFDEHNPDIAYYSCVIGFSLLGSQQRQCEDGVWSGTDPECFQQELITGDVEPVGANPSIGLGAGVFDINSPNVPVSKCNGSVTFNLRTTTTQKLLTLNVSVLLLGENDELISEPVAETVDNVASSHYSTKDPQSACVTVVCPDPGTLFLPRVGRVRITVTVLNGQAEISNVNFVDGVPCDAEINEEIIGNCDDSPENGDCGYRNSGCGATNWILTVNASNSSDVEPDEDDGVSLVSLLTNNTLESCQYFVCIPCLQDSGFAISSRDSPTKAPGGVSRRKRGAGTFIKHKNAFCLKGGTGLGEQNTPEIKMAETSNYYMSFEYNMHRKGSHYLVFYVKCKGIVDVVQLSVDTTVYSIFNALADGSTGTRCLLLHKNIESVTQKKCQKFRVYVQGISVGSKLCFSNIKFYGSHQKNKCAHGNVHNQ